MTTDVLLIVGLTEKLDFLAGPVFNKSISNFHTEKLWGVEIGLQYKLLERKKFRLMAYQLTSIPLSNRENGSPFTFLSVTLNREFALGRKFTPYAGYALTHPLGKRLERIFSYSSRVHNFPTGVMIPVGSLEVYFEYGIGKSRYFSVGVSHGIRRK
jgi:hypothetical protein